MKNYFTKDEADNIQLMLQSSKEDFLLALEILYNIEGEFKDVKDLLICAKDLNTSKFFEFFVKIKNIGTK
jgi:hypothetical protein